MDIELLTKRINGLVDYMKDCVAKPPHLTGDKTRDRIAILASFADMADNCKFEVHVDFHLTNGEVIKTSNGSIASYMAKRYAGDIIEIEDGWISLSYFADGKIYHCPYINPDAICWIDVYETNPDWAGNANKIFEEFGL